MTTKNNKRIVILIIAIFIILPSLEYSYFNLENIFNSIAAEFFFTFFYPFAVFKPISNSFGKTEAEKKDIYKKLFVGRIIILAIANLFILDAYGLDLIAFIIGFTIGMMTKIGGINNMVKTSNINQKKCSSCGALMASTNKFCTNCGLEMIEEISSSLTCPKCKRKLPPGNHFCIHCGQTVEISNAIINNEEITCSKCGNKLKPTDNFCIMCGGANTLQVNPTIDYPTSSIGDAFNPSEYPLYDKTEDQMIEYIIKEEFTKNNLNPNLTIPPIEKRKTIFTFIYAIIFFICFSLYFFHEDIGIILFVLVVATFIFFKMTKGYNITKYLIKEVKSRPDEKINYIVATTMSGAVSKTGIMFLRLASIIAAIILPLIIFNKPHIIYERQDEDYVVRFYTISLFNNEDIVKIPSEYKGRKVVGIRGEVFANVHSIKEVILPETITEIRGEAFMNASNLEKINLPQGITEIKGSTFEGCSSLEEIEIPEGVVRIGGSAFRDCISLSKATIPKSVNEIRSSAFRNTSLTSVCVSEDAYVDYKAFKGTNASVYYYENNCKSKYAENETTTGDNYKYSTYLFLNLYDSTEVNKYYKNANLQNASLKLNSINQVNNFYEFTFTYTDPSTELEFTLTKDNPSKIINDNVAFEIKVDNVFETYHNRVSLYSYYN